MIETDFTVRQAGVAYPLGLVVAREIAGKDIARPISYKIR